MLFWAKFLQKNSDTKYLQYKTRASMSPSTIPEYYDNNTQWNVYRTRTFSSAP